MVNKQLIHFVVIKILDKIKKPWSNKQILFGFFMLLKLKMGWCRPKG